jgi:predicted kinase
MPLNRNSLSHMANARFLSLTNFFLFGIGNVLCLLRKSMYYRTFKKCLSGGLTPIMPKLVFILGPAGAGKTTLANHLVKQHCAAFFDMDTLARPAAETIMTLSGLDPNDRDSPIYKQYCRDLGYRITMDAALENLLLGMDVFVIGPFTKELEDPLWIELELSKKGLSLESVDVKALFIYLPDDRAYQKRIQERNSALDAWKLENWSSFSPTLIRREIKWNLPLEFILYYDNSEPLTHERLSFIAEFIYGE